MSFVGADAHLGAKSRALRGCASKLACGRRIGPLKCCDFALDFHKTGQFRRADRVVRPYGAKRKTNTDSPENRHKTGDSGGSMWASTPTARNGQRGDFSTCTRFSNTGCRGGRPCPPLFHVPPAASGPPSEFLYIAGVYFFTPLDIRPLRAIITAHHLSGDRKN